MKRLLLAIFLLPLLASFVLGQNNQNNFNGSSGGGTVNSAAAAGNAYYPAAGTAVSADTNIVDSGAGGMTFNAAVTHFTLSQGSLTGASTPFLIHTATWNNGATAFINLISTITCTAAAANSVGININGDLILKYRTANCASAQLQIPAGTAGTPGMVFSNALTQGFSSTGAGIFGWSNGSLLTFLYNTTNGFHTISGNGYAWSSSSTDATAALDTGVGRSAAGVVSADTSAAGNGLGQFIATAYQTKTNCASSAGTCGSAASGSVSIAAAATTVTVATTGVTANSVILLTEDSSLGTKLSVTCNTTTGRTYSVTTRTAATSFVITTNSAPATNPACLNYMIVN